MAEGLDLSEIVRRTVQANARFYKGWLDLSLEYFRGISEIFGGTQETAPVETEPETGVLVLEGEEGTEARGAFLVTNDLGRTLSCELVASEFADPDGARIRAKARFEPASVQLAPGEQRVVEAVIAVDGRLAAGVGYAGEFAIKGMDGFTVPVVLRRRHRIEDAVERTEAGTPAATAAEARPAVRRKPAANKIATRKAPQGKKTAGKKTPGKRTQGGNASPKKP